MKVFKSVAQWQVCREALEARPLGFVPTMGALHQGHLSLVKASTENNALTVVSIFINPTQFDDKKDFEKYPVDYRSDLERLETAGVDVVLMPDAAQIYADDYRFKITESDFSRRSVRRLSPGSFRRCTDGGHAPVEPGRTRQCLLRRKRFSTTAIDPRYGQRIFYASEYCCLCHGSRGRWPGHEFTKPASGYQPKDAGAGALCCTEKQSHSG